MIKFVFLLFVSCINVLLAQESFEKKLRELSLAEQNQVFDTTYSKDTLEINNDFENSEYFDLDHNVLQYLHENQIFDVDSLLKHFHELYPDIDVEKLINLKDWNEDFAELFRYALNLKDVLSLSIAQIKEKFNRIGEENIKIEYLLDLFKIYSLQNKNEEIEDLLDLLKNENDEFEIMSAKEWIHRNLEKGIYNIDDDLTTRSLPQEVQDDLERQRQKKIEHFEPCGFFNRDLYKQNFKDKALAILVDLYCKQGNISEAEKTMYLIKSLEERIIAYKSLMKIYAKSKTPQEIFEIHEKYFIRGEIKDKPISNLYWLSNHSYWWSQSSSEIFHFFLESFFRNNSMDDLRSYLKDIENLKSYYEKVDDPQYIIEIFDVDETIEIANGVKHFVNNEFDQALSIDEDLADYSVECAILEDSYKCQNWKVFDKIMLEDFSTLYIGIDLMKYHKRMIPLLATFLKDKSSDEIKTLFEEKYAEFKHLLLNEVIIFCMAKNAEVSN